MADPRATSQRDSLFPFLFRLRLERAIPENWRMELSWSAVIDNTPVTAERKDYFAPFSISFRMLYSNSSKISLTESRSVATQEISFTFGARRKA